MKRSRVIEKNGNSEKHNLVVERTTTHINALSQNYSSDIVITVVYF